jgi:hypothetical protein
MCFFTNYLDLFIVGPAFANAHKTYAVPITIAVITRIESVFYMSL